MDDDVEIVSRIVVIEGGSARPRRSAPLVAELARHLARLQAWRFVEVRDLGDVTLAALRSSRARRGQRGALRGHDLAVWTGGGREDASAWRIFTDRAEALEAVGLSEQDAHADS